MPIYETVTSEKLTVVLDIGTAYTKFGFTGEFAPRNIIKSEVLFVHYEISMMLIDTSHLVSLASLAVDTAMVVNIGYKRGYSYTCLLWFAHYTGLAKALPLGAETIHNNLRAILSSNNTGIQNLPESVMEDIKIRGTENIIIAGKFERAFELLYEEDNDHLCLSTMILDAIMKVDVDLKQKLAENLVLIGGTAMAPGFKAKLKEELEKQLKFDRYNKLNIKNSLSISPCKENYAAWLGAHTERTIGITCVMQSPFHSPQ
ncbi:hypothetical protein NQ318_004187 [Aromia moschata]|uniref:Actin-related protein 10 n=1 Tax=Aromia moschata TaxID=1265417 RepID=A0AAV8WZQ8_9CUCU|nr:hypothetical protein NQ318_004187 [Aromia moschata]